MRHTSDPELDEQIRLFGENMRTARRRAGFSQVELARAAHLDRAAIGFLERAERSPELSTLLRVARALGLEAGELLRGVGSADRQSAPERAHRDQLADDPAVRFGAALRTARGRARLSQQALALRAGIDRAAISVYERGAREPNLRTILKVARALSLRPASLLEGLDSVLQQPSSGVAPLGVHCAHEVR